MTENPNSIPNPMTPATETEIKDLILGMREEMRSQFADIKAEMADIKADIKVLDRRIANVEKSLTELKTEFKTTSEKQDNRLWGLGFLVLTPVLTGFVAVVVRLFFISPIH